MEPAKPKHAGVHVPPPAIYAAVFATGALLHHLRPLPLLRTRLLSLGTIIIAASVCLVLWAASTFWRARTSVLPIRPSTALVTDGPFRFTRNPMYGAMAAAYIGAALILNSLWPLLLFPALIILMRTFVISREERYLETVFGSAYADYKRAVRRWL